MPAPYKLIYWPTLPGRGELIRVILEDQGLAYEDVARTPEGPDFAAVQGVLRAPPPGTPPAAPPILLDGDLALAQSANIALYLGKKHGLLPPGDAGLFHANQLLLTLSDIVAEVHDTHHPIATHLYFEDQKAAAERSGRLFAEVRLPKWLGYLERVLQDNGGACLLGDTVGVVELFAFQVLDGLAWAFPAGFSAATADTPGLVALQDRVRARPRLRAYLEGPGRLPYNDNGIFRRLPALDLSQG
jgi:glutathione S-transferase